MFSLDVGFDVEDMVEGEVRDKQLQIASRSAIRSNSSRAEEHGTASFRLSQSPVTINLSQMTYSTCLYKAIARLASNALAPLDIDEDIPHTPTAGQCAFAGKHSESLPLGTRVSPSRTELCFLTASMISRTDKIMRERAV
ncbi:hypothetical protein NLI96_g10644 [Meripilus lineatus]|uniref:Uncharacterized protein n=1 Tax=Meripilus lineatus TaxID=2056292 RepID=A0AAD5Y947_9APHY|nr:hypothetical protein NLI96_g10644 [Physisporinus lineatus]